MKNHNLKFKLLIIPFILFGIFFFAKSSLAANHYIRAGATGANNGTSWTDAWTRFGAISSANWVRGDTYYVAGGIYTENVSIPSKSGTNWIIIKKANASDNGADTGWDSSYATTQAVINGNFTSLTGYIELNGVTGSGTSGHGIKIHPSTSLSVVVLGNGTGPHHLYHLDVEGPGFDYGSLGTDGIYYNIGTKGFHVSDSYIHEIPRNGISIGTSAGTSWSDYGTLFENNIIERTGGVGIAYPDIHGQGMQIGYASTDSYLIIRNNIFKNIIGSAMIAYLGGTASHTYSRIYNNIFYITDLDTYEIISPGVIWTNSAGGAVTDYFYIYNNTFYNLGDGSHAYVNGKILLSSSGTITTAEAKNNLWVNSRFGYLGHIGLTVKSNNDYYGNTGYVPTGETNQVAESSNPFTNSVSYDFTLKPTANAVNTGTNLSSIFTTDKDGATRLNWSIGAYEYAGGSPPPADINPPSAPSGVEVQ